MPTIPYSTPRVNQAPVADTRLTARATGADFGSMEAAAVGELGQAVGQTGDLLAKQREQESKLQTEADRAKAQAAGNDYQVKAGELFTNFKALSAEDATPEAFAKLKEDLKNVKSEVYAPLETDGQRRMFGAFADGDIATKTVDGYTHLVGQGKVAAAKASAAMYGTSLNQFRAGPLSKNGQHSLEVAKQTLYSTPGTKEEHDLAWQKDFDSIIANSVGDKIDADNILEAQELLKQHGDAISPSVKIDIEKSIKHADQYRADAVVIKSMAAEQEAAHPVYSPSDVDDNYATVESKIQDDMNAGKMSSADGERRINALRRTTSDRRRAFMTDFNKFTKDQIGIVEGSGDLEASTHYIESKASDPRYAPIIGILANAAIAKHGNEGAKAARQAARSTENDSAYAGTVENLIESKFFDKKTDNPYGEGQDGVKSACHYFGFSAKKTDDMVRLYTNGGEDGFIKSSEVLASGIIPDANLADYTKNPSKKSDLMKTVRALWKKDRKPDGDELRKLVANARFEGEVQGKKMRYFEAQAAGDTTARAWMAAPNDAQIAEGAAGLQGLFAKTGDPAFNPVVRAASKTVPAHKELDMSVRSIVGTLFGDEATHVTNVPEVTTPGAINESASRQKAIDYYMENIAGIKTDVSFNDQQNAFATIAERGNAYARERKASADDAISSATGVISNAVDEKTGVIGEAAVQKQVEDMLGTEGDMAAPTWLNIYSRSVLGQDLSRGAKENSGLSDGEYKAKVMGALKAVFAARHGF